MKVDGTNYLKVNTIKKGKHLSKTKKSSFFSEIETESPNKDIGTIDTTKSIAPIEALLSLQEVDQSLNLVEQPILRAENLLNILDSIKLSLFDGKIPASKITSLINGLNIQRQKPLDPKLENLLDQVELRANVELAKYHKQIP